MNYIDLISNTTFSWVPIIVFLFFLIFGILIGFWNGWKSSLFFLPFTFVGLSVGVLAYKYGLSKMLPKILDSILAKTQISLDSKLDAVKNSVVETSTPFLGGVVVLFFMISFNITGISIYIPFRKKLKRNMKGKGGVFKKRIIGSLVGFVNVFPFTVLATNVGTLATDKNQFTNFNDKILKGITFGQFEGSSEIKEILKMVDLLQDEDSSLNKILSVFKNESPSSNTPEKIQGQFNDYKKSKVQLENSLNSKGITSIISSLPVENKKQSLTKSLVDSAIKNSFLSKIKTDEDKMNLTSKTQNSIVDYIKKMAVDKDSAGTKEFINGILGRIAKNPLIIK